MLTLVIDGRSDDVTAEHFAALVDVGVKMMRDAARDTGLRFTVAGLHASAPTIEWAPTATKAEVDVDAAFGHVADRLEQGIDALEQEDTAGLPDWMSETTAKALYQTSKWFGKTEVQGMAFGRNGRQHRLTRATYRTLDRLLTDETDSIGSVTGELVTVTLHNGPHLTVTDDTFGHGVRCDVDRATLRQAGQLIGSRVTVMGRVKRDWVGRPEKITSAKVELEPERRHVSVAEMAGAFEGGPDSVEWLREQRGG